MTSSIKGERKTMNNGNKNKVKTVYNSKGGVRFAHDITVGSRWRHAPTGEEVEVVDDGMAGMPEVQFVDGHTILAYPRDLLPLTEGGGQ
jgi:hypothetical protein